MDNIYVSDDLIKLNVDLESKEEIIKKLSNLMFKKDIVKKSYLDAVLKREKEFPTALSTENVSFAIPHTDPEHVNKAAIAVALLENKVNFKSMEDYDKEIGVKIVFLLAITDPSKQVTVLQSLIEIMQNEEIVKDVLTSNNRSELANIFKKRLNA